MVILLENKSIQRINRGYVSPLRHEMAVKLLKFPTFLYAITDGIIIKIIMKMIMMMIMMMMMMMMTMMMMKVVVVMMMMMMMMIMMTTTTTTITTRWSPGSLSFAV